MERIVNAFCGEYAVTSDGMVLSNKTNRFLVQGDNGHGYRTVCICINGKPKSFYVHRLVAELFLPNPNRLPEVNHKDENPSNNDVSNLEWCTSKYNKNYGNRAINFGISRGRPVVCIETGERYFSCGEAERKTGIHRGSIHACCTGYRNTKTAGGHHWSFAPDVREVKSDWNG